MGDGVTTLFDLPQNGGYSQSLISNNDVSVYVNNTALILGIDFTITPYVNSTTPRAVHLYSSPAAGAPVLVAVRTAAQYWVTNGQLTFQTSAGVRLSVGDIVEIVSWNSTKEQGIAIHVFVGPTTKGETVTEGFDTVNFDTAVVNSTSGSYDYTEGIVVQQNVFDLGFTIVDPDRLLVNLNGKWLFNGIGFTVNGSTIILPGPPIPLQTVLSVVSFTEYTVPSAMAFRIFQDMRGIQATYSITPATTTVLTQALAATDDVVHVANVSALTQPNLQNNVWGVLTVGAERIMYRNWDLDTNTVSNLLRGTAGTAASAHAAGSAIYNLGRGNLLPIEYQNYIVSDNILADGVTTEFIAYNIHLTYNAAEGFGEVPFDHGTVTGEPGSFDYGQGDPSQQLEVYVGGTRVLDGYVVANFNPTEIIFDVAPPAGVDVTMLVRRGVTWYQQGPGTASNGIPLQETNTLAARFLRGL